MTTDLVPTSKGVCADCGCRWAVDASGRPVGQVEFCDRCPCHESYRRFHPTEAPTRKARRRKS